MSTHHILAPFHLTGGGVWHAIDLASEFKKLGYTIQLWSPLPIPEKFAREYNIKLIQPYRGEIPVGGDLYIVGADTEIGSWYEHSRFDNITLVCNQHASKLLTKTLNRMTREGCIKVNISYVSTALRILTGLPGEVKPAAWDAKRFFSQAQIDPEKPLPKTKNTRFTVGRASRDSIFKHHFRDPDLYRNLINEGCDVKLLGATCLSPWLNNETNIDLLPEQPQKNVPRFLLGLDCFFYRTSLDLNEAFGLVVVEAMACGLPIIVHANCGAIDIIQHGENGFIFEDNMEAIDYILKIKEDARLRESMATQAVNTIKRYYPLKN
jgi:glycosyltransferase involved in cell wall biosynthesis